MQLHHSSPSQPSPQGLRLQHGRGNFVTICTQDRACLFGDVVGAFKSPATSGYIGGVKTEGWPEFRGRLWQRNDYEHIVRDDGALNRIRRYIDDNPARWEFADENPRKIWS